MKRIYLATTGISEIWDVDNELLILGPWCSQGVNNKRLLAERDYTLLGTPFKPAILIKEASDYCHQIYEEMLGELTREMNQLHQVNYPERYWRILIGPWLLHFIGILYDRYKRIEIAYEKYPDIFTTILSVDDCILACSDNDSFVKVVCGDDYFNLKIFSVIIRYLCPDRYEVIDFQEVSLQSPEIVRAGWQQRAWESILKRLYSGKEKTTIILSDMYHISRFDQLFMRWDKRFKNLEFASFSKSRDEAKIVDYNASLRSTIEISIKADRFRSLLTELIPLSIPLCYIEHYSLFKIKAERLWKPENKVFGSAVGWYANESLKYYAAEAAAHEAILLDFQHGGGYGVFGALPPEDISLEKDIFFTWGWQSSNASSTLTLPSPHLSKLRDKHYNQKIGNLLLIGNTVPRYRYRFDTGLNTDNMEVYFNDKYRFIENLKESAKSKLVYRPYDIDGWEEIDSIKREFPDIRLKNNGKLVNLMKKACLVVIDHPQTSFLEAFTINVPTILYWDHDVYIMRPESEPYFEMLREVGILFTDPIKAADKVNQVFNDPIRWWRSERVQGARLKFCQRFALTSDDWKSDWATALNRLLESVD